MQNHSISYSRSLLNPDREVNKDAPKEKENAMSKEEKDTPSPFSKSTNPHPDPKRK